MNFYEENHEEFFDETVNVNPSSFLEPLAKCLSQGAKILDVGCGSGRDLLWLLKRGFQPVGFEFSPGLARFARNHSGQPVIEGDFYSYDFTKHRFDALLFVGSLVHLPKKEFSSQFLSVCKALSPGGYILLTLKEGIGVSKSDDGRVFVLWSREELEVIFSRNNLKIVHFSRQVSKVRPEDIWLGYVLKIL